MQAVKYRHEVKTIASHQSIGTEEDFKWEGENDNGEEVRMGYYIVYLEVYNADGTRKIFRKKVVVGWRM
jgi:flagellar hook assembly protein FlgD